MKGRHQNLLWIQCEINKDRCEWHMLGCVYIEAKANAKATSVEMVT